MPSMWVLPRIDVLSFFIAFKYFASSVYDKSGSPVSVFSIVIFCDELILNAVIEFF
jgi:hypothetical protein